MKKLTFLALVTTLSSTFALANTTMCYKENHRSMSTIEQTKLDGGECASSKSLIDMKKEGWIIDNINIEKASNGSNYIYILKKDIQENISSMDEKMIEERILAKLEKRKKEEIQLKKKKILDSMAKSGKALYLDKCQKCHGEKADKRPFNTSRPLIELNLSDMQQSIRDYNLNDYDRGKAIIMKPYAILLTDKRVKSVYTYIKSLKSKEVQEKEEKEQLLKEQAKKENNRY